MFSKSYNMWWALNLNPGFLAPNLDSTHHLFSWDIMRDSQDCSTEPFCSLLCSSLRYPMVTSQFTEPSFTSVATLYSWAILLFREYIKPHLRAPLNSLLALGRGGVKLTSWHLPKLFFLAVQQNSSFLTSLVFSSLSAAEAWLGEDWGHLSSSILWLFSSTSNPTFSASLSME